MIYALHPHPDALSASYLQPISNIVVEATRDGSLLCLEYVIGGTLSELIIPRHSSALRRDELWKHTCFEAFLGAVTDTSYFEFNFSPSTEWAAYRFTAYRTNMTAAEVGAPAIQSSIKDDEMIVTAKIDLASISLNGALRIALSAVIEHAQGERSYWAIAHAPDKPDFHHAQSFIELSDGTI